MIHVLSLGAGVQSSVMALMAAHGEIEPMPECAIFADTQAEPAYIYDWLDWLESQLPFPVHRVTRGNLGDDQQKMSHANDGTAYLRNIIPAFTLNADGSTGMLLRKCTGDYKIQPIRKRTREIFESHDRKERISQWIGISTDEASRMKPSGVKYIEHRFPLIETDMSRGHCLAWMNNRGYPMPKKSACVFCPYQSDEQWGSRTTQEINSIKQLETEWNRLAKIDKRKTQTRGIIRFHRSLKPIDEIDFGNDFRDAQVDLFGDECEGMCGL